MNSIRNMKTTKLIVHQKGFSDAELLLNPKDFSDIQLGDVVEIWHPDEEYRLLLQVSELKEDLNKDNISVESGIAQTFQLKVYQPICLNVVNPKDVTLDLVELIIKDQYLGRSDMWRFKTFLEGKAVYLTKKLEHTNIRATVNELWTKGEKVSCGVISKDTRAVFRSPTAVMNIFIQMSSEMWEFDSFGDLYFEKAICGFLADLFAKWKEQNCCHDVTIVMFSRTYYEAKSIDEFPASIRECIQKDYKGRFYEDFYRIVVQNERYEDWQSTMIALKKLFIKYENRVLHFHDGCGERIPPAYNSMAAQGNFLETMNMSLNVFEKYYLDRNFDRTGKVAIVITPGAGVFEVDRELTTLTKQRTIDSGAGADLVCMGEQPLHAVPLFKFHSRNAVTSLDVGDDYNIPHWINHSFYTSKSQVKTSLTSTFVPRIKVASRRGYRPAADQRECIMKNEYHRADNGFPFSIDYDDYDAHVFKLPSSRTNVKKRGQVRLSTSVVTKQFGHPLPQTLAEARQLHQPRKRHVSDECIGLLVGSKESSKTSSAISIPMSRVKSDELMSNSVGADYKIIEEKSTLSKSTESSDSGEDIPQEPFRVGSAPLGQNMRFTGKAVKQNRALINPFAPTRMRVRKTFNRRRWVHAFPVDTAGTAMQPRFHQTYTKSLLDGESIHPQAPLADPSTGEVEAANIAVQLRKKKSSLKRDADLETKSLSSESEDDPQQHISTTTGLRYSDSQSSFNSHSTALTNREAIGPSHSNITSSVSQASDASYSLLWGVTGEQELCPIIAIDVDWKSMSLPAILPTTTDYFPENRNLMNDYVVADYQLLPDDVNMDLSFGQASRKPMKAQEVFNELFYQRLAQGFQLICGANTLSPRGQPDISTQKYKSKTGLMRAKSTPQTTYWLSIGRIFHRLNLIGRTITVTRYRPRHPHAQISRMYPYRFQMPDSETYDSSETHFDNEQLENYNWNYLDNYICTMGQGDYALVQSLKFWRSRFFLMPSINPATKRIIEGDERCDIYEEKTITEQEQIMCGFLRFMETLNRIRRPASTIKTRSRDENIPPEEVFKLSTTSPSIEIIEALLDQSDGLSFLPLQLGLPNNNFISAEAIRWVRQEVGGVNSINQAIDLLQRLVDEKFIRHISNKADVKFMNGFFLYYILPLTKGDKNTGLTYTDVSGFLNDWCEVLVDTNEDQTLNDLPEFLLPKLPSKQSLNLPSFGSHNTDTNSDYGAYRNIYNFSNIDLDPSSKSGRQEWGTLQYHTWFNPLCPFEIQVHWLVATGPILGDFVSSWGRKAGMFGMHLLPVPVDPFMLPDTPGSDPLRGPVFVSLNIGSLKEDGNDIFPEFDWASRDERLQLLQEAILKRFGFLLNSPRNHWPYGDENRQDQYVHMSGGMFVICMQRKARRRLRTDSFCSVNSGSSPDKASSDLDKVGFLWSWNFLLTKKWRTSNTGDEHFQDKVLADFRSFCSNHENRLKDFWEESCQKVSFIQI